MLTLLSITKLESKEKVMNISKLKIEMKSLNGYNLVALATSRILKLSSTEVSPQDSGCSEST